MAQARDGIRRVVLFQPRTGWVADVAASGMIAPQYTEDGSQFETGDGRSEDISRMRRLVVPVVDADTIRHLTVMKKEGCNVQAIAVGWSNHIAWYENAAFSLRAFGSGPGSFAGTQIILENTLFWSGIWRHQSIISSVPWDCEASALDDDDATYYFQGPTGYKGPRWDVRGTGAEVNGKGTLLTKSGAGDPTLTIYFPLAGATIEAAPSWTGTVLQLDWSGATLSTLTADGSAGNTDVIEAECWQLKFTATAATIAPGLYITDPGSSGVENRTGGCIDCSDATATYAGPPSWSS